MSRNLLEGRETALQDKAAHDPMRALRLQRQLHGRPAADRPAVPYNPFGRDLKLIEQKRLDDLVGTVDRLLVRDALGGTMRFREGEKNKKSCPRPRPHRGARVRTIASRTPRQTRNDRGRWCHRQDGGRPFSPHSSSRQWDIESGSWLQTKDGVSYNTQKNGRQ